MCWNFYVRILNFSSEWQFSGYYDFCTSFLFYRIAVRWSEIIIQTAEINSNESKLILDPLWIL
jgi:hypothetical protein